MEGLENQANEMVYGEISDYADQMQAGQMNPDLFENRSDPRNANGLNPGEPGVTVSDDLVGSGNLSEQQAGIPPQMGLGMGEEMGGEEMGMLEEEYGAF